jgi:hypothetical protein
MPDTLVISNTSPLLYLNLIGQLDLLASLYQLVTIPAAVRDELIAGKKKGVQVPDIDNLKWLQVISLKDRTLIPLVTDLGPGEAEVIWAVVLPDYTISGSLARLVLSLRRSSQVLCHQLNQSSMLSNQQGCGLATI